MSMQGSHDPGFKNELWVTDKVPTFPLYLYIKKKDSTVKVQKPWSADLNTLFLKIQVARQAIDSHG